LRVMQNQPDGKSRVLIDNPEYTGYTAVAWFPDGKSVLVVITKRDNSYQFARVSVPDGAVTVLKPLERGLPSGPKLSPDGRYIVYSTATVRPAQPNEHIYVLAADGSSETEIVKTTGRNRNPVWTPDGKHILFTSDRSGKFDLWSIAVQNGKAAGEPSLVSTDLPRTMSAIGIRGGSYYYASQSEDISFLHIVDAASGGNTPSTEKFVGGLPAWSPDGKSIAVKRPHTGSAGYDLVVHSLETGEERSYLTSVGAAVGGPPIWLHDATGILTGILRDRGAAPYRIDLKTGEFKELPAGVLLGVLSPDDKTTYVVRRDGKTPARIVSIDAKTGQERAVFVSPTATVLLIALSPDGRTLALSRTEGGSERKLHIARVSIDGSGYRELLTMTTSPTRWPGARTGVRSCLISYSQETPAWESCGSPPRAAPHL
jgi:Tol biopolymer transport system component